ILINFYSILKNKHYIFFFLTVLLSTTNTWSHTITVCSSCSVKTIHEAIQQASEGDTIFVKKEIYKEAKVKNDKFILIKGEYLPTIGGEEKGEIVAISADSGSIEGFKIINVGGRYTAD